jgi:hypothetical protein
VDLHPTGDDPKGPLTRMSSPLTVNLRCDSPEEPWTTICPSEEAVLAVSININAVAAASTSSAFAGVFLNERGIGP